MKMNDALQSKVQVWGFEESFLIFKDFSLGMILEISPKDISTATDESLNSFARKTADLLNGLPEGMSIQFCQMIDSDVSRILGQHEALGEGGAPDVARKLSENRLTRLRDRESRGQIPKQKLFVILRRNFMRQPVSKKPLFQFWNTKSKPVDFSRTHLERELKLFTTVVENVKNDFLSLGISPRSLSEEEVFSLLFDQWNPGHPIEHGKFDREDFRDQLLLNDLIVSPKGFHLSRLHHRVLSLKVMPEQTFASMSERLRDLPFDSKLTLTIEVLDQAKEDFNLQNQRRITYAMHSGKKGVSDLDAQLKLQDIESLLERRVSGETKIFRASLNVILRHRNEDELDSQVEAVLQKFRELSGSEGMVESLASAAIFFDIALPNARSKERTRLMTTDVLSDFLPVFGDWLGHKDPRVLLSNRNGVPVGFDPFSSSLTNFNQIVSGGSGAGKSFLTNCILGQLMRERPKVFIIDIGGSYRKLTESFGGQYISIGTDSDLSLNPFDLTDKSPEAVDQKIKFMTSLVEIMTKEDAAKGIGRLERSEIEAAVSELLNTEAEPQLKHLREKLLLSPEISVSRLGKILGPWVGDSPYGKFVDRKSTLELKKEIVCFDLKGLESKPDLQAVCLFLITDLIWREVQRDRTNAKFVVFDECWSLLENETGSRFLGEVFRTFRKYRASAIAISQTMDDFANSKVASAILPNASVKWILKQTGGNLPALGSLLRLNEREMKLIESLESKKGFFSEAFLIAGDDRQVVVMDSLPLEYWIATTDSKDLQSIEREVEKHLELSGLTLLEHMAERFPRGASVL